MLHGPKTPLPLLVGCAVAGGLALALLLAAGALLVRAHLRRRSRALAVAAGASNPWGFMDDLEAARRECKLLEAARRNSRR